MLRVKGLIQEPSWPDFAEISAQQKFARGLHDNRASPVS